MVPWHPPCALISLIFSSLDPETNCCYFEVVLVEFLFRFPLSHYSVLQLAFILNHFLCSCQGARQFLPLFQKASCRSVFVLRTLKAIQTRNAISNSFRCDAVRLCQPASCAFDSLSNFVAMLYPPCWWLLWTIECLATLIVSTIG